MHKPSIIPIMACILPLMVCLALVIFSPFLHDQIHDQIDLYGPIYQHVPKPSCEINDRTRSCSYDAFSGSRSPKSLDEAKILMAKTPRILAALGLDEGVDGHLTFRIPPAWIPNHLATKDDAPKDDDLYFLVDRLGVGWSHIEAHSIVLIHETYLDDSRAYEILDDDFVPNGHQDWRAAVWMNGALHRTRPDLQVILHTHSPWQRVHAATTRTLPMIDQNSMRFYDRIAYVPYPGIAVDSTKADYLAKPFLSKDILILRNHGAVFGAHTLQNALSLAYFLERVLEVTHRADPLGHTIFHPIDKEVVVKTAKKLQGQAEELMAVFLFDSLERRFLSGL